MSYHSILVESADDVAIIRLNDQKSLNGTASFNGPWATPLIIVKVLLRSSINAPQYSPEIEGSCQRHSRTASLPFAT
jgi:hypothetical protein